LRDIADAQGDVDAFIAQYDAEARKVPRIAAEIAERLLAAGRAAEALKALDAAEHKRSGWPEFEWEDARIAALDALERSNDAQAARWSWFERFLSERHLRDYPETSSRLRRYRGRKWRSRLRGEFCKFLGDSDVPVVMACAGSRSETRNGARREIKWR
jgi:hypothetical protein